MSIRPLLIRADAGGVLGTGHVMRMIALSQAYVRRGGRVTIASVKCPESMVTRVEELGIDHRMLEGCELGDAQDAASTLKLSHELEAQWMVLDGYHFDEAYQKEVSGHGAKVLVVDDYGHCSTWHCDAVINQNLGAEDWECGNTSQADMQWLLGAPFALIREEFLASISEAAEKSFPAGRLLVTLGGSDPDNVTLMVLNALEKTSSEGLEIRVLAGGANPHKGALDAFSESSRHQVEIKSNVRDMPAMYEWADAVISAGGSTCWEWLAYGISGAVVTIADNQEPIVAELKKQNLAFSLGWATPDSAVHWDQRLDEWLQGKTDGLSFDERRKIFDGHGAARVAAFLANDGLWCRPATLGDAKLYFDWASDPQVRSSGFHTSELIWPDHCEWFEKMILDPASRLYVVSNAMDDHVGQVRLTPDPSGYMEIGLSVDRKFRGKGFGGRMLKQVLDQDEKELNHSKGYIARVKVANKPSSNLFVNLGFKESERDSEHEYFIYLKIIETKGNGIFN